MKPHLSFALAAALLLAGGVHAQSPAGAAKPALAAHVKKDISRHRALARAHEEAARCLETGSSEEQCQKNLLAACRGLAIGKYCGLKHEH